MKKIKSTLLAVLSVSALITGMTSCSKKDKSDFVFKIGTANSGLCGAPLHIGIDKGIFAEEFGKAGLKFETIEINIQEATALCVSKKIDASLGLAGSLIPQMDNGLDVSFLTGVHTGCTKFYVKADSPYKTVADLRGKVIGFPGVQDSSTIAFQRKYFDLGIPAFGPEADFTIAVYNLPDLPLALENGAVEAVGLHDPIAYIAERDYGFRNILDTTSDEKFSQEYCCMTFVSNDVAQKYPEHTKAFIRAVLKASAYVQANPEDSAKLQIENGQMSGDVEANGYLLRTYNYTPSVNLAGKTVENTIDQLVDMGVMQNVKDKAAFVKNHFISFDGVPDSYVYNADGTYSETYVSKL